MLAMSDLDPRAESVSSKGLLGWFVPSRPQFTACNVLLLFKSEIKYVYKRIHSFAFFMPYYLGKHFCVPMKKPFQTGLTLEGKNLLLWVDPH